MRKYLPIWILFSFSLLFATSLTGQNNWVDKGNAALQLGNYLEAMDYFSWSLRKDTNSEAASGMAMCYYSLRQFKEAEHYFAAAENHGGVTPTLRKYFARSLWANGKLEEAAYWLQKAQPSVSYSPEKIVAKLLGDSANTEVRQITFDKNIREFSPIVLPDGILFTATRNQAAVVYKNQSDGRQTTGLFWKKKLDSLSFGPTKPFGYKSNLSENEGPATIFENEMIYSASADQKGKFLGLFQQSLAKETRGETAPLDLNIEGYSSQHPSLSADGKTLYFSSNRPGGKGGYDLWKVERNDGKWGNPKNLVGINTQEDELFPYISAVGKLYFASEGLEGMGGLDIYEAIPANDGGYTLHNLGFPINSSADDFGICTFGDDKQGYFSSNRGSNGSDDNLFEFKKLIPEFDCTPQKEPNYCFIFSESDEMGLNITDLPVKRQWDFGDGTTSFGDTVRHCFPGVGTYTVQLNLIDTILVFVFMNEAQYTVEIEAIEQPYIDCASEVQLGKSLELDARKSHLPNNQVQDFYWNLGNGWQKGTATQAYEAERLGKQTLQLGLTLTDEMGVPAPTRCIEREIDVIKDPVKIRTQNTTPTVSTKVIDQKNVPENPVDIKRELEEAPLADYDLADSLARFSVQVLQSETPIDTNDFRKKGLTPIKVLFAKGMYNYLIGEEEDLEKIYPMYRRAIDKGYEQSLVIGIVEGKIISANDSTLYMRLPIGQEAVSVRIVQGKLVNSKGNPLNAMVTWQDLIQGAMTDTVHSNPTDGNFFVKLKNGSLFGYSVEAEGFFPVSGNVDLRGKSVKKGDDIIHLPPTTLYTMEEMRQAGVPIRLNNIFFDSNSARLRKESYPELHRLARILAEYPDWKSEILGHTDDVGDLEFNQDLSERRAKAIIKYLIMSGIDVSRIQPIGFGESKPDVPNTNAANRQLNRRVEFRFVPFGE